MNSREDATYRLRLSEEFLAEAEAESALDTARQAVVASRGVTDYFTT